VGLKAAFSSKSDKRLTASYRTVHSPYAY